MFNGLSVKKVLISLLILIVGLLPAKFPVKAAMTLTAVPVQNNADTQVRLEWSSVVGAQYYEILRDGVLIHTIDVNLDPEYLSYTDTGLTPQTVYDYQVNALDSGYSLLDSSMDSVTTSEVLKPTIQSVKYNVSTGEFSIEWVHNSQAASGSIIRTIDGSNEWTINDTSTSYSLLIPGVICGQEVGFEVIAFDSALQQSEPSDPVTTVPVQPPVITDVSISYGTSTITWGQYSYIDSFELERSRYEESGWGVWQSVYAEIGPGDESAEDVPPNGGIYRYRLKAEDSSSYSGYSAISDSVIKPEAPTDVVCSIIDSNTIEISWTSSQYNVSELQVSRREEGEDSFSILDVLPSSSNSYVDSNFDLNTTYYYKITAYESTENYDTSEICSISTSIPESPSSLALTVESSESIKLEWTDNSDNEDGFIIERKEGDGDFTQIDTIAANTTTYTDTGLQTGVTYIYRVRAYNVFGNSGYTSEASASTETVILPSSLTVTPTSSSTIELSWSYPDSVSCGTVIERKTGQSGSWSVIATLPAGVTRYTNTGLLANTEYFYRIRSVVGENAWSVPYPDNDTGISTFTLLGNVTVHGYASAFNEIYLSWSENSGATQFIIEKKVSGGDFVPVATVGANTSHWYDTSLIPNAVYHYRIKAISNNNESVYSNEVIIANTYLKEPDDFEVSAVSDKEVELTWTDTTTGETGFEIWRRVYGESSYELYDTVGQNVTRFVDKDVEEGVRYYYKVRAFAIENNSYSSFTHYERVVVGMLNPPGDLDYEVLSKSRIKLTWTDNSDNESGFKIERKIGRDGVWRTVETLSKNKTSCKDSGLDDDVKYYYRVKAYSSKYNNSAYSEEIEVSTARPKAPSDLNCASLSSNRIRLTWEDNSYNEEGFKIERKRIGDSSFRTVGRVGANVTTYTDSWLSPGQFYYYRVAAYNEAGDAYSDYSYAVTREAVTFNDIDNAWWAREAIESLASRDVIESRDGDEFRPNDTITKAEFVCMVVRAFNLHMTPVGSFKDVNIGDWFYDEVMIANNLGIISGDENNRFYPLKHLTREDMAVIITRALRVTGKPIKGHSNSVLEKYLDKGLISPYAVSSMASLIGEGIMSGKSERSLAPKDTVTRAEAAVLIYNVMDR